MPGDSLTVLSWNLFLGSGAPENALDHLRKHWHVWISDRRPQRSLEPLARVIAEHGADVVCLQEVDEGSWRNGYRNQIAEIADAAGLPYRYFAAQRKSHCNDGIALLSRYPLEAPSATVLVHELEQRGLIQAQIDFGGRSVRIAVTHLASLPFNGALRKKQAAHVADVLRRSSGPTILAADFNCEPESDELRPLTRTAGFRALASEPSFPAYSPRLRFDNVFATPDVTAVEARVLGARHSDHLPVLAKLRFAD